MDDGFAEHLMYTNELDKYTLLLYNIKKFPKKYYFERSKVRTRVKLGTKTGPTFQYSLFKGFLVPKNII